MRRDGVLRHDRVSGLLRWGVVLSGMAAIAESVLFLLWFRAREGSLFPSDIIGASVVPVLTWLPLVAWSTRVRAAMLHAVAWLLVAWVGFTSLFGLGLFWIPSVLAILILSLIVFTRRRSFA